MKRILYVGTYTSGDSPGEGIYIYQVQLSGQLEYLDTVKGVVNPSFLAIDPKERYLYAVSEATALDGSAGGAVNAFAIDHGTGKLKCLNLRTSAGGAPCHITVDASGKYVLVANYDGGNFSVFPVLRDGSLGEATDIVPHPDVVDGIAPRSTRDAHAHCITLDRANRYAFAVNLSRDNIMVYKFDLEEGKLIANTNGVCPPHLTRNAVTRCILYE